jgi:hypothetical protein
VKRIRSKAELAYDHSRAQEIERKELAPISAPVNKGFVSMGVWQ